MDRSELASFLRDRRARVQPGDVGLEAGRRRRTAGLRREEVALLAGMSVDYYIRLEQARGPRPSSQVMTALARALRLTDDERTHMFRLASLVSESSAAPRRDVPSVVLRLLDGLDNMPAYVLDAGYDILAFNRLAAVLLGDFSDLSLAERNIIRWLFLQPQRMRFTPEERDAYAREAVADLRVSAARYPRDARIRRLIRELLAASPEFVEIWADHQVGPRRDGPKTMIHPAVGPLELECQVLTVPGLEQRVIVYSASPGASAEALDLLRVVGLEHLPSAGPPARRP
ncbi:MULTISPECIES: helix-turn-helix transcriptional regulator [unclassified Pseudofrankia]|uniref:helix-turn-helix transcriptional regulator n=1 Tax=unclassified Pseudofrankia TaxID=2994372 RepID=UPI0008D9FA86|nr:MULTISPECIES: helix-turn-helix transcriptional regulator [unclassified Pseudofrankia]MDT3440008.1 helix-turn-helix transcriptional regulator [Pseudofrankia sp. BMG5.37]OHV56753.1 transcriptional regulator [Pseudofrankia sp. BMG5.36]